MSNSCWPTWDLLDPPSGVDGRLWSAGWFVPLAVDGWARTDEEVRRAVAEVRRESCVRVVIEALGAQDNASGAVQLAVLGSPKRNPRAGRRPMRILLLPASHSLSARLRYMQGLQGRPPAPLDAELHRVLGESAGYQRALRRQRTTAADVEAVWQAVKPWLAADQIRRLGSRDRTSRRHGRLRQRMLHELKGSSVPIRRPRQIGAAFTDMAEAELLRVVEEAQGLVDAVRNDPDTFWPLTPEELDRISRPPAVRRHPADYESRLQDEEDRAKLGPNEVLAHDITLLRLGYVLDAREAPPRARRAVRRAAARARRALLVQLHRAKAR